jgi:hypothetical protein
MPIRTWIRQPFRVASADRYPKVSCSQRSQWRPTLTRECHRPQGSFPSQSQLSCVSCASSAGTYTAAVGNLSYTVPFLPPALTAAKSACQCSQPAAGATLSHIRLNGSNVQVCVDCAPSSNATGSSGLQCAATAAASASADLAYLSQALNINLQGASQVSTHWCKCKLASCTAHVSTATALCRSGCTTSDDSHLD